MDLERQRLKADLRRCEERLRLVTKATRAGTFEWFVTTDEVTWTPELEVLYGLQPGTFGGKLEHWIELIHPADRSAAEAALRDGARSGSFMATWRCQTADGTVRWLEASGSLDKPGDGRPQRMSGVHVDVTSRREAADRLRRVDAVGRLALESAQLGTWTLDLTTERVSWDQRARNLCGFDEPEVSLARALSRIHPDDQKLVNDTMVEATRANDEAVYDIEFRVCPPAEPMRWLRGLGQVRSDVIRDNGKPRVFVGVLMDVTGQKLAEEKLAEASRRKDDFLAMLGHELRNPLAAIRTAGELVKTKSESDSLIGRASAVLERQTLHMGKLLDGLLDLSRITRGKLTVEKKPIDLVEVLRDVLADCATAAEMKKIELRTDIEASALPMRADPARLTQIFDNLVGNAIKYTPSGGFVTVTATDRGEVAEAIVRDNGIGFDPRLASSLFEAFQQGPQDISRSAGGLGLGLALARGLVELHGGSIEGHSEGIGKGAEFVVRLPLVRIVEASKTARQSKNHQPSLHVLLIEDNEDSADMLQALLERSGHEAQIATRGPEGIASARAHHPDVVLCDIGLPDGVTGFDVARQLRRDPSTRDIALVALTGYGRPEDKIASAEAGFDEHLVKPVDIQTLERVLTRLSRKRPRKS